MEVDDFNRKVITESFNRAVCAFLATESIRLPRGRRYLLR